jgi:hypothetical protein
MLSIGTSVIMTPIATIIIFSSIGTASYASCPFWTSFIMITLCITSLIMLSISTTSITMRTICITAFLISSLCICCFISTFDRCKIIFCCNNISYSRSCN